jgi:anti-sigma factor RsiW
VKVTRDVIYDLLPAYFAGEASSDTRALVEECFDADPELRRKAEQFRALDRDRSSSGADTDANRERLAFDDMRTRLRRRQSAIVSALCALMAFGMAIVAGMDRHLGSGKIGVIFGAVFGLISVWHWVASVRVVAGENRSGSSPSK